MSSEQFLKSIVPPLLWNLGSRFKRRFARSTTLFEYAPQGWSTPLPGSANSEEFWTAFLAQEQAALRGADRADSRRRAVLYADGDENAKYAVFGYVLALAARERQTALACSITVEISATTTGSAGRWSRASSSTTTARNCRASPKPDAGSLLT